VIRVAAVGDVHYGTDSSGTLRRFLDELPARADVLLLAGDVTRQGDPAEADVLARELEHAAVPKVAVLGNHDYHLDAQDEIGSRLTEAGVAVLEQDAFVMEANGTKLVVAGTKGFGGGFAGACISDFGEPETKAFVRHTKNIARGLEQALRSYDADARIALLHYSPIEQTLRGERLEIYPFLGSYLLAEAIDRVGAELVLHGHAHNGSEKGMTPGGISVRNVALPVIKHAYNVYCVGSAVS
jgi:Icc-related predicted phosphoesterase